MLQNHKRLHHLLKVSFSERSAETTQELLEDTGPSINPLDQITLGGDLTANQISQEQQGDNLVITLLNDRGARKGGHLLSPKNALVCLKTF